MFRAVGAEAEPLLPAGGEGGRVGRACPQPAGADGHECPRIARGAGGVVDRSGLHLRFLEHERHRLLAIEDDPPRGDLVAEAHRPRFETGAGAPRHHRRTFGLDLDRLEPRSQASLLPVASEDDGEEFAGELVVRPIGKRPHDLDMFLERDHVRRHVHAQAPPTTDEHGDRLLGVLVGRGCRSRVPGRRALRPHRPRDRRPRDQASGEALELELHVPIETDRVDAADARPLVAPLRAGKEADLHRPSTPGGASITELHRLGGADLHLVELDVAGDDLHLVVGIWSRGRAPDRHMSTEAAADEP